MQPSEPIRHLSIVGVAMVGWCGLLTVFGSAPLGPTPTSTAAALATHVARDSIVVDGLADDAGWRDVRRASGFVQQEPDEGRPATERTIVRAAFDDGALYFLIEAEDSQPEQILGQLTRRDTQSSSDWVHVWLDTHEDGRNAYRFSVNPAGVVQDARVYDDGLEDASWDVVWEAKARTSTSGWTAELRVPLSQLRYDQGRPRWGFIARRDLRRRNEKSWLVAMPRGSGRLVSLFGKLDGLGELPSAWDLAVVPYLRGGLTRDAGVGGLAGSAGVDVRFGLGASVNLDVSVNPDFGQVEADPSTLNLTAREVYLEEKRGFFLEGREILRYSLGLGDNNPETLFYSRRIGKEAILGAAKLTGKTSGGWSIGLLDAVTASGDDEPLANAAVLRLSKDLREGRTIVGLIATHLARDLEDPTSELLTQAASGGVDLSHRFFDGLEVRAKLYGTAVSGTTEAITAVQESSVRYFQRPDATHVELDPTRTSLAGWGGQLVFGKLAGPHWRAMLAAQVQSPELEVSPLGYLPSADAQTVVAWGQLRGDEPGETFRQWQVNVNAWGTRTFGGESKGLGGNVNLWGMLVDWVELWAGAEYLGSGLDVTALRGGPALLRPARVVGWAGGMTDARSSVVVLVDSWIERSDDDAGHAAGVKVTAKLHPAPWLELSLIPGWEHLRDDAQYLDTLDPTSPSPTWLVGHLHRETVSLAMRVNWTIDPQLSVQLYASPYLSGGNYRTPRAVVAPRAATWTERFEAADYDGPTRFLFSELRSNVVVRWEYALGSTLFAVWSHGQSEEREDRGRVIVARDLPDLTRAPAVDTVMVKLAYWLAL